MKTIDIEKLETEFKKIRDKSKDIQLSQIKDYLLEQSYFDETHLDILIGRLTNAVGQRNYSQSISFGLSYPALLAIVSMVLGAIGLFFPGSSKIVCACVIAVGVVMLITALRLKAQSYVYDLVDLLYELKQELLE